MAWSQGRAPLPGLSLKRAYAHRASSIHGIELRGLSDIEYTVARDKNHPHYNEIDDTQSAIQDQGKVSKQLTDRFL